MMRSLSVVLANLMGRNGELNSESIARINMAVDFERFQESKFVIVCGWAYRSDSDIAVADAMKHYLFANYPHVAHKVLSQKMSRDTVGDAIFSRIYVDELFGNSAFDIVNIFTSNYHVARTKEIFKFVFGDQIAVVVRGVPGFDDEETRFREENSLKAFRRTFSGAPSGDLQLIFAKLKNSHPFYNGSMHPMIPELSVVVSLFKGEEYSS